ncbi:rod shape-determining protein [Pseudomonas stutzeri]|nr:rod shape-determining protein [Stutzerimonas stutzeri]
MFNLFRNTLYLRLQADLLRVLHVESGQTFSEAPLLALRHDGKGQRMPLAAGNAALALDGQPGVELVNGFRHPRSLLADFAVAEQTLQRLLKRIQPPALLRPAPTVVLQPLERLEGGLTQVEIRALIELLKGAGARQVYIWTGRELHGHELEHLHFPEAGGSLLWPA